jgi:hypothetical protein
MRLEAPRHRVRRDLLGFAAFIMACGLTDIFLIHTLWVPAYGIEGLAKALTVRPDMRGPSRDVPAACARLIRITTDAQFI